MGLPADSSFFQVIFETGRLTEDFLISALGGLDHMERLLCELWHWRHHEVCDPMRCLLLQNGKC